MPVIRLHMRLREVNKHSLIARAEEAIAHLPYAEKTRIEVTDQEVSWGASTETNRARKSEYVSVWSKRGKEERLTELAACLAPLGYDIHTGILEAAYNPEEAANLEPASEEQQGDSNC